MGTLAFIVNPAIRFCALHAGAEVRQMEGYSGGCHRKGACGIEAKEPDARLSLRGNVRSNI